MPPLQNTQIGSPHNQAQPLLDWDEVVRRTQKITFQLTSDEDAGTCFAVSISRGPQRRVRRYNFATAGHVVEHLLGASLPIRLISADKQSIYEVMPDSYSIFLLGSKAFDSAIVEVRTHRRIVQKRHLLPMWQPGELIPRGTEVGLVGFPGLVGNEFCFFKGVISGYLTRPRTYLVDSVAISGVSGGPAFDRGARIIGLVSSYIPNRVDSRTTLPGLSTLIPISTIRYLESHKKQATPVKRKPVDSSPLKG